MDRQRAEPAATGGYREVDIRLLALDLTTAELPRIVGSQGDGLGQLRRRSGVAVVGDLLLSSIDATRRVQVLAHESKVQGQSALRRSSADRAELSSAQRPSARSEVAKTARRSPCRHVTSSFMPVIFQLVCCRWTSTW